MFKVGDRVKIIGTSKVCNKGCGNIICPYIGKIGIIKLIDSNDNMRVGVNCFNGTYGWCSGFDARYITLAIKKIVKQFGIVEFMKTNK